MAVLSASTETPVDPLLAVGQASTVLLHTADVSIWMSSWTEPPTTVTVTDSTGTSTSVASDVSNASASKVDTSPLTVTSNWITSTSEAPGGTAGDGGGAEGGGGDGGGEFMMHRRWSGWHVGVNPGTICAGLHRLSPSCRSTHTPSSRVSQLAPLMYRSQPQFSRVPHPPHVDLHLRRVLLHDFVVQ